MGAVQKYYAEQLHGLAGAEAREYLKRRGIDQGQVARFGIGLAPDNRTALKRALAHLGEEPLIETGMLIKPEEGGESYDRFRGRLMIPIRDPRGRVIAFGGRILGRGEPKYLNSPDTPLFDKGRTLYNLDLAGPASRTARAPDRGRGLYGRDRPRPRRHRRSRRAQRHRGDRSPARADVAARPLADPVLRRRQRRAQGRDPRRASAPCPTSAPNAPCASSSFRRARTPTTSCDSGGREAFEALLGNAEPLDARLWRHEACDVR